MKTVRRIITLASFVFLIGIAVAYYNTSSLGYDNANIISFNNEEVKIFDYNIKYKDVEKKYNSIKKLFYEKPIVVQYTAKNTQHIGILCINAVNTQYIDMTHTVRCQK
jgi:TPP-dependent 2-oxoacid decarboxylase